ncbi:InlB B-repeat-containing protein [Haloplasma contractile]|uniref:Internalin-A protein n=1 Tax=Haloplasma contractile SSD-17B TaxID=1033810 RepID=U2FNU3_9MOLU|nr:InlB B-repeat-containing protein [Haloplasma contractile]ERJ12784.1 Internalin-A protein [Haloplasma contractile SSD-17B]
MKKMFLLVTVLFVFVAFICSQTTVQAKDKTKVKTDETIVYEEVSYYETVYENGKIKEQRKLNKDEYGKKVKEVKAKKLEKIKKHDETSNFDTYENDLNDTNLNHSEINSLTSSCLEFVCDTPIAPGGGEPTITFDSNGGTDVQSITQGYGTTFQEPDSPTRYGYNFEGWYKDSNLTQEYSFSTMPSSDINLYAKWEEITNTTVVTCKLHFETCQGAAQTTRSLTKLVTTVSLNPQSTTGLSVRNELTWTGSPEHSVKDFSGIGYNSAWLEPDLNSIQAETVVRYIPTNQYGYLDSTFSYIYVPETLTYSENKDVIKIDRINGLLSWDIEKVYQSYWGTTEGPTAPRIPGHDSIQEGISIVEVTYTLNSDFNLIETNSYAALKSTTIWGDYRHTYEDWNITFDGFTLRAYFDKQQAFLGVKITPTISADLSRKNDIQFNFN